MSEGKLLAPIVDGVIVVVGSGQSTKGMATRCLRELDQIGADVFGLVLNRQTHTRGGYLRQQQDLFYSHAELHTPPEEMAEGELPEMELEPEENEEEERAQNLAHLEILEDAAAAAEDH
jgi:hypothetical protein